MAQNQVKISVLRQKVLNLAAVYHCDLIEVMAYMYHYFYIYIYHYF